jgi:hypothetical protein
MEPVHVWLLDRLVQWEPPLGEILDSSQGRFGEAASVGTHASEEWGAGVPRKPWTPAELNLDATLKGFRSLRPSAKLTKHASELRMPLAEAVAFDEASRKHAGDRNWGYQVATRNDDELDRPNPESASGGDRGT